MFRNKRVIMPLCALFWLALWHLASVWVGEDILLVSPLAAGARLLELSRQSAFWAAIGFSLTRIMGGFLLALGTGSALAAMAYRFPAVRYLLAPLVSAVKSVPVASYAVLCIFFFGSGSLSLVISFLMTLPVVYGTMLEGLRHTDVKLLEMARVFRLPPLRRLRYIYIPQCMPYLLSAIDTGIGIAWKSGVAAEVIGLSKGSIGSYIYDAKNYLDMRGLFAWTIAVMLLCYLVEKSILLLIARAARALERR